MFSLNHNWGDDNSLSHTDLQLLEGACGKKAKKKKGKKKKKNIANASNVRPSSSQQSRSITPEAKQPGDASYVKSRSTAQIIRHRTKVDSGKRNVNKFVQRLQAGRFRWVNEKLYTIKGLEAFQMFQNDPNLFHIYHSGFQEQVDKWPVNPLDNIIDLIRNR